MKTLSCFFFDPKPLSLKSVSFMIFVHILSFHQFNKALLTPIRSKELYPTPQNRDTNIKRITWIIFAENQLFPKTVSFSLPAQSLSCILQHTKIWPDGLLWARSSGFGPIINHSMFNFFLHKNLPLKTSHQPMIQKVRGLDITLLDTTKIKNFS